MPTKNKGPIEILCQEIGAPFTNNRESIPILVAFVVVLVNEVDCMIKIAKQIATVTGEKIPSETDEVFECIKTMLLIRNREELIGAAVKAHNIAHASDEGSCNHYIDMLSSCVSVIRFGLEQPCRSRHAAEAVNHVWERKYGITLFDKHSNYWGKQWARVKFHEALGVEANAKFGS